MKELIIIRHGEADHMVSDLTGGWSDDHLTDMGRSQARLTGAYLSRLIGDAGFGFYSSDLARAAETAGLVAESLRVRPVLTAGLRELNNGAAANLTKTEAAEIGIPMTQPIVDWAPFPGAESWAAMSQRVVAFLDSICDVGQERVVLVMHAGSGNAAICWWLGIGIGEKNIAFELDPCSISRFGVNAWGERTVEKLNDTSHLANAGS